MADFECVSQESSLLIALTPGPFPLRTPNAATLFAWVPNTFHRRAEIAKTREGKW